MSSLLLIENTSVSTLISFLEAAEATGGADRASLAKFAGFSDRTAQRALRSLEALGLVKNTDDTYQSVASGTGRGLDEEEGKLLLKKALLNFRPFEVLCEGLALGEEIDTAMRKTAVLLGVPTDERDRFETLAKWARDLGILEYDADENLRVAGELVVESEEDLGRIASEDIESEARARLYTARRVGRDAHEFIGETERHLLSESLLTFRNDPDACIDKAGQALEDFLREVAIERGHAQDASNCNGPTQLANLLRGEDVILPNHLHRTSSLSAMRATSAHSKDKSTATPWNLDEHAAFWTIDGVLLLIRSVYNWVYQGRQIA